MGRMKPKSCQKTNGDDKMPEVSREPIGYEKKESDTSNGFDEEPWKSYVS